MTKTNVCKVFISYMFYEAKKIKSLESDWPQWNTYGYKMSSGHWKQIIVLILCLSTLPFVHKAIQSALQWHRNTLRKVKLWENMKSLKSLEAEKFRNDKRKKKQQKMFKNDKSRDKTRTSKNCFMIRRWYRYQVCPGSKFHSWGAEELKAASPGLVLIPGNTEKTSPDELSSLEVNQRCIEAQDHIGLCRQEIRV